MVSKSLFSSAGGAPNPRSAMILALSLVTSITLLWFLLWSGGGGGGLTPYGFYGLGAGSQNPFSRVPQTVLVDVEFYEHDDYKDLSPENDHLWEDLLTGNGGFLVQEDPDEGQLRRYGIGMFHQLHCLQMIRGSLQAAEMPGGSGANHAHGQHAHSGDASGKAHVLHCLDYLRQSILCMADDTIEIPRRRPDGRNVIDGMFTHQCKSPDSLYTLSRSSPEYHEPSSYSHIE